MDKYLIGELKRYVPLQELQSFLSKWSNGDPSGCDTIDDSIRSLDSLFIRQPDLINDLSKIILRYKYAGKGSVSWSCPSKKMSIVKAGIEHLLMMKAGGNLFSGELRPIITEEPALNRATWQDKDLRLEFVYRDRSYFIEMDYELKEIWPTKRANVLIKSLENSFVVEARADFYQAKKLHKKIASILGIQIEIVEFSDDQINELKLDLNAKKRSAKHKKAAGDIDVVEMIASETIDDLDNAEEYKKYLGNDELRKALYRFKFNAHEDDSDFTIYISKKGSIWFVSRVPEEVRQHVFSCVRRVKGL
jgi:hypothetical protein